MLPIQNPICQDLSSKSTQMETGTYKEKISRGAVEEIQSDFIKRILGLTILQLVIIVLDINEYRFAVLPFLLCLLQTLPYLFAKKFKFHNRFWFWTEIISNIAASLVVVEALIMPNIQQQTLNKVLFLLSFLCQLPIKGLGFSSTILMEICINTYSVLRIHFFLNKEEIIFLVSSLFTIAFLGGSGQLSFMGNLIKTQDFFEQIEKRQKLLEFLLLQNQPEHTLVIDQHKLRADYKFDENNSSKDGVKNLSDFIKDKHNYCKARTQKLQKKKIDSDNKIIEIELDRVNIVQTPEQIKDFLLKTQLSKINQQIDFNEIGETHLENCGPMNLFDFITSLYDRKNAKPNKKRKSDEKQSKHRCRYFTAKGELTEGESIMKNMDMIFFEWKWKDDHLLFIKYEDHTLYDENKNLRDFDKLKDRLMATIVHDMRTPLNVILEMNERARRLSVNCGDEYFSMVDINAKLLLSLISDLLDYSLFKENKLRLIFTEFSLQTALDESVALIKLQAHHKGVAVKVTNNIKSGCIYTDERRLKQILINLLTNSLKFTKSGLISILAENVPHLPIIKIEVADTGSGISPSNLSKLFEPFATFDAKDGVNKQGIGLGLFICKVIASQLGPLNQLAIDSELGKGTKFSLFIYEDMRQIPQSKIEIESLIHRGEPEAFKISSLSSGSSGMKPRKLFQKSYEASLGVDEEANLGCLNYLKDISKKNPFRGKEGDSPKSAGGKCYRKLPLIQRVPLSQNIVSIEETQPESHILNEGNKEGNLKYRNFPSIDLHFSKNLTPRDKPKLHIMIVDDNIFNILVIESQLQKIDFLDFHISKACTGKEAIEKFKNFNIIPEDILPYCEGDLIIQPIKLIFMDCLMPIMNGWEATRQIKALLQTERYYSTDIVGLTATLCSENERLSCFQAGMDYLFQKPIHYEVIREFLVDKYKK